MLRSSPLCSIMSRCPAEDKSRRFRLQLSNHRYLMIKEIKEGENSLVTLWERIKVYSRLQLDYAKLTAADKLTMILGLVAMGLLGVLLGSVFLFFVSLAVVQFIAPYVGLGWAYMIMSGFALILIALMIVLRRTLILNPLARFISRVILK